MNASCAKLNMEDEVDNGEFHSLYLKHTLIVGIDGFVIGDYTVLAKQKVKQLQVLECNGTSCQGSTYKFDKYGNMIYASPSYNNSYTLLEYNKHHKLMEELVSYDGEALEVRKEYLYYNDSVIEKLSEMKGELILTKAIPNPNYIRDIEYSDAKHISRQTVFNMFFPCGEEYFQENIISFEYLKNGLIDKVTIYNVLADKSKSYDFHYTY